VRAKVEVLIEKCNRNSKIFFLFGRHTDKMWTFGRFFVAEAYAIRIPDGLAQALQSFGWIAVYIPGIRNSIINKLKSYNYGKNYWN